MSAIVDWVHNDCEEGQPLPYQGHRYPTAEEALGEDPVAVEWHWPENNGDQNIDEEEGDSDLEPRSRGFSGCSVERG